MICVSKLASEQERLSPPLTTHLFSRLRKVVEILSWIFTRIEEEPFLPYDLLLSRPNTPKSSLYDHYFFPKHPEIETAMHDCKRHAKWWRNQDLIENRKNYCIIAVFSDLLPSWKVQSSYNSNTNRHDYFYKHSTIIKEELYHIFLIWLFVAFPNTPESVGVGMDRCLVYGRKWK